MGELLNTIICDDVLNGIKKLPDKSIDCVITSPPYWQLRELENMNKIRVRVTINDFVIELI